MGSRWKPLLSRVPAWNITSTQDHAAAGTAKLAWARTSWKGDKLPKLWWGTEQRRTALGADFLNNGILRTTDVTIGDMRVCGFWAHNRRLGVWDPVVPSVRLLFHLQHLRDGGLRQVLRICRIEAAQPVRSVLKPALVHLARQIFSSGQT